MYFSVRVTHLARSEPTCPSISKEPSSSEKVVQLSGNSKVQWEESAEVAGRLFTAQLDRFPIPPNDERRLKVIQNLEKLRISLKALTRSQANLDEEDVSSLPLHAKLSTHCPAW